MKAWKLNKDNSIEAVDLCYSEMAPVEARVRSDMMPFWLTFNPSPVDFRMWFDSVACIPKVFSYLEDDRFWYMDESIIIQILEGEGSIERGSYHATKAGYGDKRSPGAAARERQDNISLRESNTTLAWNFPVAVESRFGHWDE